MSRSRVAFLGLGLLGAPMAARLLAQGWPLTVWNRSAEKAVDLAAAGAHVASTPAEAAAAECVALCLTDAAAVEAVVFGQNGLAPALTPAHLIVDFSTLGVRTTCSLATRVAETTGAAWLDAPVSGGPPAARSGELAIFCGGETETLARVAPLLTDLSRQFTHMGPVGAGQAAKLCNQLIVSATLAAIGESMALGAALGVDAARLPAAMAGGYADSTPLQVFGPRMAERRFEPKLGEVATMLKDVRAVLADGAETGIRLRLAEATEAIYAFAGAEGLLHEDLAALTLLPER